MQFNEDLFYECFETNEQSDLLVSSSNSFHSNNQGLCEKWLGKKYK